MSTVGLLLKTRRHLIQRIHLCCMVFVFMPWNINAQGDISDTESPYTKVNPPLLAVKWSPMHLWYFYPSLQFSLEHKVSKSLNIQYEGGWIVDLQDQGPEYEDKRGYRLTAELRHYIPSPSMIPLYVSADFYYHNISFDRSSVLGFNCVGGGCSYYQYATYPVRNEELGPALKFGMLLFPGWSHNRSFFFDFNAGFAYRMINYRYGVDPGENGEFFDSRDDILFSPNESLTNKVRFVMGVRLCVALVK